MYMAIASWLNENGGVVSVLIFVSTLFLGWVSGIFAALRRRPKFEISTIEGPTFSCTYELGKEFNHHSVHRTGIVLYLSVANVGSAASSIDNVSVAYHWNLIPFSLLWLRRRLGWFWVEHQTASLEDYWVKIGDNAKVYPFLTQTSTLLPREPNTYVNIGQSTKGIVYFEQEESWGGCFPKESGGKTQVKIRIRDAFGKHHTLKTTIPVVSLQKAREFNRSFGKTLSELRGEKLPDDERI